MKRNIVWVAGVLICTGGGLWAVAGDRTGATDSNPPPKKEGTTGGEVGKESGQPTRTADVKAEKSIVIENGLWYEATIYQLEIRNAGDKPADVRNLGLALGGGKSRMSETLKLVRGSFSLAPGDKALIITNSKIDANDDYRLTFANVYRYFASAGQKLHFTPAGLSLVDDAGNSVTELDPTIMEAVSTCCRNPNPGGGGNDCHDCGNCNQACTGYCQTNVGNRTCCTTLHGCAYKVGLDPTDCNLSGCPSGAVCCEP